MTRYERKQKREQKKKQRIENWKKLDNTVVSKWMLAIAFVAPFALSVGFMGIAYLITLNATSTVQTISLVVGTFLGLGLSIGIIFFIQKIINKKLDETKEKSSDSEESEKQFHSN